jgi:putative ABC transport system permease protein
MGASAGQVVSLLNRDFLILVLLSNIISWPVAYYFMRRWLEGFAYRMEFGLSPFEWATIVPFIASLATIVVIAFITTSLVSVRAAHTNPVESLSRE